MSYDALLILSFGGPERADDVMPFLENVLRGKNVPRERLLEVAEHYYLFGGKTPINDYARALIRGLEAELAAKGPKLPVYWGNRHWHPMLADTLRRMRDAGVRRALAFITSAFSSYSGCRQYLENIEQARAEVGEDAPEIHPLRKFFNHPGFIEPMIERTEDALGMVHSPRNRLVFTAHNVPVWMAESSQYVEQLREACRLVAEGAGRADWELVYQSRSGPPSQPWLEPDVADYLRQAQAEGVKDVVLAPIGFLSDHMEVLYDLDVEARKLAAELGIHLVRAATVGLHPRFLAMIRELVEERVSGSAKLAAGTLGPAPDECEAACCPLPRGRGPVR